LRADARLGLLAAVSAALAGWIAAALGPERLHALGEGVVFLPEPPRHFLEAAAVATVLLVAWWRRGG
jgi:hypothetical protein